MVRLIVALVLVLSLTGCMTYDRAKVVKIPIVICPVPEYEVEPELPIYLLSEDDKGDWEKIAKSYAISIIKLQAHIDKLDSQLNRYRSGNGEITDGTTDKQE